LRFSLTIARSALRLSLAWAFCAGLFGLACSGAPEPPASGNAEAAGAQPPAGPAPVEAPARPAFRPRALWILCEGSQRVLEDADRVASLVERAVALGASDLFVQVYRNDRAWYDATLPDAGPYHALVEKTGGDRLRDLIERAHAAGMRVHAWVNVLSLHHNREAPLLRALGPEAVHVDRRGRSLLDYPELEVPPPDGPWYRMGTRGLYLDPAAPGVATRLVATFAELVTRYPELDGLHLDYIRHPDVLPFVPGSRFGVGLDFGYGAQSRARFRSETGLAGPYRDPDRPDPSRIVNANAWDAWRRDQVTALVGEIGDAARAARPGLLLSAAVIAYTDRAYLSLAQDWQRWLEEDLIDFAVPMIYTLDDRLFRYQVERFAHGPLAERILPGIGVWLYAKRPAGALEQIAIARRAGAIGDALFSYDAIADTPALFDALHEAAAAELAPKRGEAP